MSENEHVEITAISEDAILIEWPNVISPVIVGTISQLTKQLISVLGHKFIEHIASYNSLLIYYRFDLITYPQLLSNIVEQLATISSTDTNYTHEGEINIPVYYDGWDLQDVAETLGLTTEDVIKLHSQESYIAYAQGFTPGFCYLASTNKALQLPRKSTPRISVPRGAVAIADQQTAVYPNSSPGGWHILGVTPTAMYQATAHSFKPTISLGQVVRFSPISKQEFIALAGYEPESLLI